MTLNPAGYLLDLNLMPVPSRGHPAWLCSCSVSAGAEHIHTHSSSLASEDMTPSFYWQSTALLCHPKPSAAATSTPLPERLRGAVAEQGQVPACAPHRLTPRWPADAMPAHSNPKPRAILPFLYSAPVCSLLPPDYNLSLSTSLYSCFCFQARSLS